MQRACIDALDQGFSPAAIHLLKFNLITLFHTKKRFPKRRRAGRQALLEIMSSLGQLQRNPSFVLGKKQNKPIAYFNTIPSPRIIDESVRLIFSWERLRTRTRM